MTIQQNSALLKSAVHIAARHISAKSDTAKVASMKALQTLCNGNMKLFSASMAIAQEQYKG